jgi:hypothetical protein
MESFCDKSLYEMIKDLESRVNTLEGKRQQSQEPLIADASCYSTWPENQASLLKELHELIQIAHGCGLHGAADFIKRFVTTPQRTGDYKS